MKTHSIYLCSFFISLSLSLSDSDFALFHWHSVQGCAFYSAEALLKHAHFLLFCFFRFFSFSDSDSLYLSFFLRFLSFNELAIVRRFMGSRIFWRLLRTFWTPSVLSLSQTCQHRLAAVAQTSPKKERSASQDELYEIGTDSELELVCHSLFRSVLPISLSLSHSLFPFSSLPSFPILSLSLSLS